jgi:hypothetical protein
MIAHVLSVREETLRAMQNAVCQHLKLAATTRCVWGRAECPELIYGSLALKLNQFGFGPLGKSPGDVKNVNSSVETIAVAFSRLPRTITRTVGQDSSGRATHGHDRCCKKNGRSTLQQEIIRVFEFVATRCKTRETWR